MSTKLAGIVCTLLFICAAGCDTAESVQPKFVAAVQANNADTALPLLTKFPSLSHAKNEFGVSVLMLALSNGNYELSTALLNAGADANNAGGANPLTTMAGNPTAVALLVAHGANVNVADSLGVTPLMRAANAGDLKTARLLVGKGADVNAKDNAGGRTVLHHAVYGASADIASFLLESGANPSAKDSDGKTALEMAQGGTSPKTDAELFVENSTDAAALREAAQRSVRAAAGQPTQGKDLSTVIAVLRKAEPPGK